MTADGLPDEAFSQLCKKENFPTIEGPNPATVEQIEQDGKPACRISTTNIPSEGTSSIVWSISSENGNFVFSATTKADFDDATMTVNFPGKAVEASGGSKKLQRCFAGVRVRDAAALHGGHGAVPRRPSQPFPYGNG